MGKKSKYKTSVKKKTLNPEFNEVKHFLWLTSDCNTLNTSFEDFSVLNKMFRSVSDILTSVSMMHTFFFKLPHL